MYRGLQRCTEVYRGVQRCTEFSYFDVLTLPKTEENGLMYRQPFQIQRLEFQGSSLPIPELRRNRNNFSLQSLYCIYIVSYSVQSTI